MAEEKMKFTFLDDNGKPVKDAPQEETIQDSSEEQGSEGLETQTEDEITEQEGEQEGTTTEDSTDDREDSSDAGGSEVPDGDVQPEESSDVEDYSDDDDSEEVEEDNDIVDYDELPEAVQKYLDFMEDTGGSLQDFVNINQDLSKLPQDDVIGRFLKSKYPTLDSEDIEYEIESRFGESDDDTSADIRRKKVEKKKFYAEALSSLQSGTEKYKAELGSSNALPAQAKDAIEFRKNFELQQAQSTKQLEAVRKSFISESNKVLGKDFKGFEVKVGNETILYKPEDFAKVKEQNMNVNNLLNKFLGKDGNVKDVAGYHKALAVASNPEGFAQHFFELGKAAMAEEDAKDSRNVQTARGVQPKPKSKQPKFKFLDDDSSFNNGKMKLKDY